MNLFPDQAEALSQKIAEQSKKTHQSKILVFPPVALIHSVVNQLKETKAEVGAQNISEFNDGAFTGENSTELIKQTGCAWTLVGHSERRSLFHESDQVCQRKIDKAIRSGLNVIYCIGENENQRDSGDYLKVISDQLNFFIDGVMDQNSDLDFCVAYEPVWAIGTGKNAKISQVVEVHQMIREKLDNSKIGNDSQKINILYGGSAKKTNAADLLKQDLVDGLLIGGSSLTEEFIQIINISEEL